VSTRTHRLTGFGPAVLTAAPALAGLLFVPVRSVLAALVFGPINVWVLPVDILR
jgi:hypothetical protein